MTTIRILTSEAGNMKTASIERPLSTKAAILMKPMQVILENRPLAELKPDEVLVKVMAVGVCGSDVHYYEHGRIGRKNVERPLIQGHECSGVVAAVGTNVTLVAVGDRVAVEPGISCFHCEFCKAGKYNLCPSVQFLSSPPVDGAFSEYIIHPEHLLFPIPDHLTFEEATLVEPLSVGIHACRRAGLEAGSTVLITGMGPVGLTAIIAAKALGAGKIIVTDVEPFRLQLAGQLGAVCIHAAEQNVAEEIASITLGKGADMVIDTSGQAGVLDTSIELLKRGGKLVLIGFPNVERVPLNLTLMLQKEIDLYSTFRYTNTYPFGIELLASGRFNIKPLITDYYCLEDTGLALEQARTNKKASMKVIVYPNGRVSP
ncbi:MULTISPECIES: NAD(P)-dependent alcohol dehydrogenase [unclassified Paenibacillus]|uniref:NAD(P)-dependent alcohol dehydrogenase n=1 Tax=unclassified Paenibacillus TaxID=185978 RepID=UPI00363F043C